MRPCARHLALQARLREVRAVGLQSALRSGSPLNLLWWSRSNSIRLRDADLGTGQSSLDGAQIRSHPSVILGRSNRLRSSAPRQQCPQASRPPRSRRAVERNAADYLQPNCSRLTRAKPGTCFRFRGLHTIEINQDHDQGSNEKWQQQANQVQSRQVGRTLPRKRARPRANKAEVTSRTRKPASRATRTQNKRTRARPEYGLLFTTSFLDRDSLCSRGASAERLHLRPQACSQDHMLTREQEFLSAAGELAHLKCVAHENVGTPR